MLKANVIDLKSPVMKMRALLIVAVWVFAFLPLLLGRVAHAHIYDNTFQGLKTVNCSLGVDPDCSPSDGSNQPNFVSTKSVNIRVEYVGHRPYLRDMNSNSLYSLSSDLLKSPPPIVRDVVNNCQFKTKDGYCTIEAAVLVDSVEMIENWSLQRYQIAK